MKVLILLSLASIIFAKNIEQGQPISAYGYIKKYAIPLAEKIRAFEEANLQARIAGGSVSSLGQFPYQAGVITSYLGVSRSAVCGGSLVSPKRVIHAAHCWFDGLYQGYHATVVLGSNTVFYGGTRLNATKVVIHPEWDFRDLHNDVTVIFLPNCVSYSSTISPIALPFGAQLTEDYAGQVAVASGYGYTFDGDDISSSQVLSYVQLSVITNEVCRQFYRFNVFDSTICTSGAGGQSTCGGDSGGPLAVIRNNQPVLIGVTSFGSPWGCEIGYPAGFARVTYLIDFFKQHM